MNNVKNMFYALSLSLLISPMISGADAGNTAASSASSASSAAQTPAPTASATGNANAASGNDFKAKLWNIYNAHPVRYQVAGVATATAGVFAAVYYNSKTFRDFCNKTAAKVKSAINPTRAILGGLGIAAAGYGAKYAYDKHKATIDPWLTKNKGLAYTGLAVGLSALGYGLYKFVTSGKSEENQQDTKALELLVALGEKLKRFPKDHDIFNMINDVKNGEEVDLLKLSANPKFVAQLNKEERALLEEAVIALTCANSLRDNTKKA